MSAQPRPTQLLASTLIVALVLCHIVGAFCVMVPHSVAGEPSIQVSPIDHMVAGEGTCSDVVTSSARSLPIEESAALASTGSYSCAVAPTTIASENSESPLKRSDLPLYTFLRVFRI